MLVPFEVIAVVAIAVAPLPESIPVALPLVVVATISRWVRGRSWAEVAQPGSIGGGTRAAIGAAVGVVALAIAVVAGSDSVSALTQSSIEVGITRGNPKLAMLVIVHVAVAATAAELALRGWIVERVLELSPGSPVLPVIVGALAEAIVTPGEPGTRIGAALFGVGLGWMFVAGGRNVVAPICARVLFQGGAVAIAALRIVN